MTRRKVFLFEMEKEKEANMWRRNFFSEEKENREGRGGKYFENENIFFRGQVNREGKGGKYLEKENIFCRGEENWRRKIYGEGKITTTKRPD